MKEVDVWIIYDNSDYDRERIAFGGKRFRTRINNIDKFNRIKDYDR